MSIFVLRSSWVRAPRWLVGLALAACLAAGGCWKHDDTTIRMTGSDTMVNLAEAWAEAFHDRPARHLAASQRGRLGRGHRRALLGQDPDRHGQPADEAQGNRAGQTQQRRPGAQGVHRRPRRAGDLRQQEQPDRDRSRFAELAEIYGEDGKITHLGATGRRQSRPAPTARSFASAGRTARGTYAYFKEAVLGKKREYKQGATSQSGSSDVVALVSNTPCAIGYSGMGYNSDEVKVLKRLARRRASRGVGADGGNRRSTAATRSRGRCTSTRWASRPASLQEFIQWVLSPEGGKQIVEEQRLRAGQRSQPAAEVRPSTARRATDVSHESTRTPVDRRRTQPSGASGAVVRCSRLPEAGDRRP